MCHMCVCVWSVLFSFLFFFFFFVQFILSVFNIYCLYYNKNFIPSYHVHAYIYSFTSFLFLNSHNLFSIYNHHSSILKLSIYIYIYVCINIFNLDLPLINVDDDDCLVLSHKWWVIIDVMRVMLMSFKYIYICFCTIYVYINIYIYVHYYYYDTFEEYLIGSVCCTAGSNVLYKIFSIYYI